MPPQKEEPRVAIAPFWRAKKFTAAQKYYILEPLLRRNILRPAESQDSVERGVQNFWRNILNRPVGQVVLNERDWLQMAQGASGIVINGGMHGGIVQQGSGNTAKDARGGDDLEKVLRLVQALRMDAVAQHPADAEELESLADALEGDARKSRWSQVQRTLDRVAGLVTSSGKVLAATEKAIQIFT